MLDSSFLSWYAERENACNRTYWFLQPLLPSTVLCAVCVENKEVSSGSAINSCHDVQGSFPEELSQAPNLIVLRMDNNNLR